MTDRRRDIESRVEEALMRRSTDVEPEPSADWDGVQRGVHRAQRMRVAVSTVAALALIGAGVFVVPKLMNRDSGGGVARPGPTATGTPSPSVPTPAVPAGWSPLVYDEHGYWIVLPDEWRSGWFEGHAEYRPEGLPGLAVGEDTFAVETYWTEGSIATPQGTRTETEINGMKASRWEAPDQGGAHIVTYEVELPCKEPYYAEPPADINCGSTLLRVVVYASTQELWAEHGETGERIARSLHHASEQMPSGITSYRTFTGRSSVPWDVKTWLVTRFMESRIFGDMERMDSYMTANAKKQYDAKEGGLTRYDPESNRRLVTYEIVGREGADANSDEFRVRITEAGLETDDMLTYFETLGVGPGNTVEEQHSHPVLIRFAVREKS